MLLNNLKFQNLKFQNFISMTPHRRETALGNEPVRFYKVVALTFLVLTIALLGVIVFMSAKRATITILSKADPVETVMSMPIDGLDATKGMIEKIDVNLIKKFKPAATREEDSLATGVATLINDSSTNQPLVATTRLLTADGVLFRLKRGVTVLAKGKIDVEVYADKTGKVSEIGPSKFTIPGLGEARQKLVYAESSQAMVGGIKKFGVIGSEDLKEAEDQFRVDLQKDGEIKLSVLHPEMKVVYSLLNVDIKSDKEIGAVAEEFTLTGKATVVAVFYNGVQINDLVKQELQKKVISDVEVFTTNEAEPQISLEEYDQAAGRAVLKVAGTGLVELNPESSQLQKIIFFGKTRDEVRRYLLSLDHVSGVEIKFSPAWMGTVPHVAEHVNVVVKKVE